MHDARMIIGLSGWMDGGDVSLGTVKYLVKHLEARELADIEPDHFYIYNFPGSMGISSLFRPHTNIEEGLVTSFDEPENKFYCHERGNVVLFQGKEPNIHWKEYAECIFEVASACRVREIYFVGSVSGLVPHTRDPIFWSSASDEETRGRMQAHGMYPSAYEGPASIATYLITRAQEHDISIATMVATIPSYIDGKNAKCIHAAVERLGMVLDLSIDLTELESARDHFVRQAQMALEGDSKLAEKVRKLEEMYDDELAPDDDDDLREWFERQNLKAD